MAEGADDDLRRVWAVILNHLRVSLGKGVKTRDETPRILIIFRD